MKRLRRLALGLVLLAGLSGAVLRLLADTSAAPVVDRHLSLIEIGETVGPFLVEGRDARDIGSLHLKTAQCERPIVWSALPFSDTVPDELMARIYPPSEWDVRYIYNKRLYDRAGLPAKISIRLRLLILDLTLQPRAASDSYIFSLHTPVGCIVDSDAALAAVDSINAAYRLRWLARGRD